MHTERLKLEIIALPDAPFLLELVNTEGWKKFIGDRNVHSVADAEQYVRKMTADDISCVWTVKSLKDGVPLGIITLIQRDYLDCPDIGFAFLPQFAKKGFAFEASNVVLQDLISKQEIPCVYATTIPENDASISLLQKLGLSFEREIEVDNERLLLFKLVN